MSDMLEKVALAIDAQDLRRDGWSEDEIRERIRTHPDPSPFARAYAQAALSAIEETNVVVPREPSEHQWQRFAETTFRNLPDGQFTFSLLDALYSEGHLGLRKLSAAQEDGDG